MAGNLPPSNPIARKTSDDKTTPDSFAVVPQIKLPYDAGVVQSFKSGEQDVEKLVENFIIPLLCKFETVADKYLGSSLLGNIILEGGSAAYNAATYLLSTEGEEAILAMTFCENDAAQLKRIVSSIVVLAGQVGNNVPKFLLDALSRADNFLANIVDSVNELVMASPLKTVMAVGVLESLTLNKNNEFIKLETTYDKLLYKFHNLLKITFDKRDIFESLLVPSGPMYNFYKQCYSKSGNENSNLAATYGSALKTLCSASLPIMVINGVNFGISSTVTSISTFMQNLVALTSFVHAILSEGSATSRMCGTLNGYLGSEIIITGVQQIITLLGNGTNVTMKIIQDQFAAALGTVLESPALMCFLSERPWLIPGYQKVTSRHVPREEIFDKAQGFMFARTVLRPILYIGGYHLVNQAYYGWRGIGTILNYFKNPGHFVLTINNYMNTKSDGFNFVEDAIDLFFTDLLVNKGASAWTRPLTRFLCGSDTACLHAFSHTRAGMELMPKCYIEKYFEQKLLYVHNPKISETNNNSVDFALWIEYSDPKVSAQELKANLTALMDSEVTFESLSPTQKLKFIQDKWYPSDKPRGLEITLVDATKARNTKMFSHIAKQCTYPAIHTYDLNGEGHQLALLELQKAWFYCVPTLIASFSWLASCYSSVKFMSDAFPPGTTEMTIEAFIEFHNLSNKPEAWEPFFKSRAEHLEFSASYPPGDDVLTYLVGQVQDYDESRRLKLNITDSPVIRDFGPEKHQIHLEGSLEWHMIEGNKYLMVHKYGVSDTASKPEGMEADLTQGVGSAAQSNTTARSASLFQNEGDGFSSMNGGGNFKMYLPNISQMIDYMMGCARISDDFVPVRTDMARKNAFKYGMNCPWSAQYFLHYLHFLDPHLELTPTYVRDMAINSESSETLHPGKTDPNNTFLLNTISRAFDEYNTISRGYAVSLEAKSFEDELKKLNLRKDSDEFDESEPWNPKARESSRKGVWELGVGESLINADPNPTITDLQTLAKDRTKGDDAHSFVNYLELTTKLDDLLKTEGIKSLDLKHGGDAQAIIDAYERKAPGHKELTAAQLDVLKEITALYQQLKTPEATTALGGLSAAIVAKLENAKEYLSSWWPISKPERTAGDATLHP